MMKQGLPLTTIDFVSTFLHTKGTKRSNSLQQHNNTIHNKRKRYRTSHYSMYKENEMYIEIHIGTDILG